jgi:hypothetical protein
MAQNLSQIIQKIENKIKDLINIETISDLDIYIAEIYAAQEEVENYLFTLNKALNSGEIDPTEYSIISTFKVHLSKFWAIATSFDIFLAQAEETITLLDQKLLSFESTIWYQAPKKQYCGATDTQTFNFTKQGVAPDGNCALSSFGCTREEITETLFLHASNPLIREKFYSIIAAAVELENWPYETDYHQVKNNFHNCQQDYDQYNLGLLEKHQDYFELDPSAENIEELRELRDQVFLEELNRRCSRSEGAEKQGIQQDILQLMTKKEALNQARQAHKEFYTSEEIFMSYADYLSEDKVWIDIESMALHAENNNIRLFIWQEDCTSTGSSLNNIYAPRVAESVATRTVHILYGKNADHFDVLQEVSPTLILTPQVKPSSPSTQWWDKENRTARRPSFMSTGNFGVNGSSTVFKKMQQPPQGKPDSNLNPDAKPFWPARRAF